MCLFGIQGQRAKTRSSSSSFGMTSWFARGGQKPSAFRFGMRYPLAMAKDRMPVNLADPKDIRAKMPQITKLLADARQEFEALKEQVEMLTRIVGEPSGSAQVPGSGGSSGSVPTALDRKAPRRPRPQKAAPSQERALRALEKAGRPMGPASLFRFMEAEGMDRPQSVSALNAVLWAASKAGRIVKAPNGVYAPPGFPTDRPLTDYDEAARKGMPVPGRLPGVNGSAPLAVAQQASPKGDGPRGGDQEQSGEVGSRQGAG
jgi:hypothetical protein